MKRSDDSAYEAVVLAADGAGVAGGAATHANDANRRAAEAEQNVQVLHNYSHQTEGGGTRFRAGLSIQKRNYVSIAHWRTSKMHAYRRGGLAALDGCGAARGRISTSDRSGGGDSKDREGKHGEADDRGEHVDRREYGG